MNEEPINQRRRDLRYLVNSRPLISASSFHF
jgi:hypothetical protein